jgi:hypothetical protein
MRTLSMVLIQYDNAIDSRIIATEKRICEDIGRRY